MEVILRHPFAIMAVAAAYLYTIVCLMVIAHRLQKNKLWMALVPVLNVYYFLSLAHDPGKWVLLVLVPFVNIGVIVYAFMVICEKRGRPAWWGLFSLLPPAGLLLQGALAFSDVTDARDRAPVVTPPVEI